MSRLGEQQTAYYPGIQPRCLSSRSTRARPSETAPSARKTRARVGRHSRHRMAVVAPNTQRALHLVQLQAVPRQKHAGGVSACRRRDSAAECVSDTHGSVEVDG